MGQFFFNYPHLLDESLKRNWVAIRSSDTGIVDNIHDKLVRYIKKDSVYSPSTVQSSIEPKYLYLKEIPWLIFRQNLSDSINKRKSLEFESRYITEKSLIIYHNPNSNNLVAIDTMNKKSFELHSITSVKKDEFNKRFSKFLNFIFADDINGVDNDLGCNFYMQVPLTQNIKADDGTVKISAYSAMSLTKEDILNFHRDIDEIVACLRLVSSIVNSQLAYRYGEAGTKLRNKYLYHSAIFSARSKRMLHLFDTVRELAKTEVPLAFTGEPGSSRLDMAKFLHKNSNRSKKPFEVVDALLLDNICRKENPSCDHGNESIFNRIIGRCFGGIIYVKNFHLLSEGNKNRVIVFLDRSLQNLNEGKNIRLIFGLEKYDSVVTRLNLVNIAVPPLREIRGDIINIANHILKRNLIKYDREDIEFTHDAISFIKTLPLENNMLDLDVIISHAVKKSTSKSIGKEELHFVGDEIVFTCPLTKIPIDRKTGKIADNVLESINSCKMGRVAPTSVWPLSLKQIRQAKEIGLLGTDSFGLSFFYLWYSRYWIVEGGNEVNLKQARKFFKINSPNAIRTRLTKRIGKFLPHGTTMPRVNSFIKDYARKFDSWLKNN